MTEVYLALGSNVGDSPQFMAQAVEQLGALLADLRAAPMYSSKAVGYTDQPDFLNTAVSGQTDLLPTDLLHAVKEIEQQIGRIERFRWGPREIDIDIIFYGDTVLDSPELTIPHPRFAERSFVLQPIAALAPELVDPTSGQTISALLALLPPESLAALTSDL